MNNQADDALSFAVFLVVPSGGKIDYKDVEKDLRRKYPNLTTDQVSHVIDEAYRITKRSIELNPGAG